MARDHYTYQLSCSECGAEGSAAGTDNGNGPNFNIDTVSGGFRQGLYSPNPFAQTFRCKCGTLADVVQT